MTEYIDFSTIAVYPSEGRGKPRSGMFEFVVWSDKFDTTAVVRAEYDGTELNIVSKSMDPVVDSFVLHSKECLSDAATAIGRAECTPPSAPARVLCLRCRRSCTGEPSSRQLKSKAQCSYTCTCGLEELVRGV